MRREKDRIRTFREWPADAAVAPADLAKAGFFFLGPRDAVQCFCCGGILRCWVQGDSPGDEHRRHFPTCCFILGRAVGNIPLQAGSSDSVDEMEAEDSRLTTFHNWPTEASVQPDVLARAGFFYTGHGDNVKCYYCDGGLRNWEPGDDPWQEHAKWFPRCEFLIQTRGQEYISNIQDAHFHLGDTLSSSSRDIGPRNASPLPDMIGGLAASSALLSPVVQTVLQMGFDSSLVESLVQTKYLLTGRQYTSVSNLVSDVLQAEQEDRETAPQSRVSKSGGCLRWCSYCVCSCCDYLVCAFQSQRRGRAPVLLASEHIWPLEKKLSHLSFLREPALIPLTVNEPSPEELLRQLQEERTCKVCMDKLVSIVFIPCGHLVVCSDCATSLRHCPICRAVIRGSVRAFMS
uniref:RING-type E3 ubiquitin transferase n=1 Tax=Tetraodon nigroviridis TaxID=99883 RepID=H3CEA9_TETNG